MRTLTRVTLVSEDKRVSVKDVLKYSYTAGGIVDCMFHTLREVGAPYQPWFQDQIKERGWIVRQGVEIPFKPWVVDVLLQVRSGGQA